MKFTNVSGCEAGWTAGYERDGRELLVVIVKATYDMPQPGDVPRLAAEQVPLVQADEFTGEPGTSAPRRETDYAHRKPGCDVLLVGSAYAPAGRQATEVQVAMQFGTLAKRFSVVGERCWHKSLLGVRAGHPAPFVSMPITYDRAFGGTDCSEEARGGPVHAYLANPVGKGFWRHADPADGAPLPNTEEVGRPVRDHDGTYAPMAFSPIGRWWAPRASYAGTYDQQWLDERAPFWPDDFDDRYFQAAPPDQVLQQAQGDEDVVLRGLTPDGLRAFRLPGQRMSVTFIPHRGKDVTRQAMLDTVLFEPDQNRFCLTWRASLPLGKSIFDVKETIAGNLSETWHRVRRFPGKTYYRSLADAVAARRGRR
jgi:hypothetical protein